MPGNMASGLASGVGRSPAGPACVRADVVLRDLDRDIEIDDAHCGSVGYWVDGGTWTVGGLSGLCELSTNAKLESKVTVP